LGSAKGLHTFSVVDVVVVGSVAGSVVVVSWVVVVALVVVLALVVAALVVMALVVAALVVITSVVVASVVSTFLGASKTFETLADSLGASIDKLATTGACLLLHLLNL
jgi:hypothetical protein